MCDCLLHEAVPENEGLFILDMCRRNQHFVVRILVQIH